MTAITLPPLPPTDKILKIANDIDGNIEYVHYYNSDTLRARDIEVAQAVLEGAAKVCNDLWDLRDDERARMHAAKCAAAIHTLEVKHHE
jgi:hypothetical protein